MAGFGLNLWFNFLNNVWCRGTVTRFEFPPLLMHKRWLPLQKQIMTRDTVIELNNFLTDNGYYDRDDFEKVNEIIIDTWDNKLQEAIIKDVKEKIIGTEIQKTKSLFDIVSDEQGATLYKSFFELTDKEEKIEIIIKLVVNHDKGVIYLGSRHADKEQYTGQSKLLGQVYRKLKNADNQFGYFRPVDFFTFKIA
jgi:hypothetical protein